MKIIKSGTNPNTKVHQITCRWCGCVFEFTRGEAKAVSDQRDGDYLEINCPECKRPNTKADK